MNDELFELRCTGTELKILSAALAMAIGGTPTMVARILGQTREAVLERLSRYIDGVRDAAWADLKADSRAELIRLRKSVSAIVAIPGELVTVVSQILMSCEDDPDTASDLSSFTGITEYGLRPGEFRALATRLGTAVR